jgi:ADP-ribose pyrophosphatase
MKKIKEKILFKGNFLWLKEATFKADTGENIIWESVQRPKKQKIIVVIAKLIHSGKYLIIRQFRPAVNNYVIGFPAGIVETSDLRKEALKELKEETGYHGKIVSMSPAFKFSAALIDEDVHVAFAQVDEKATCNAKPCQDLEVEEEIEVLAVNSNDLGKLIKKEIKKGHIIGAAVWYFYVGKSQRF